ncbi:S24 family peptidase [Parabacteroides merdae]|uniref:LexA family transcriptional regulator n=1 Tax=Parabacteroides merdae TaxID=46503 RepID=A0A3R6IUB6_9BACT|nr:S24 family peptidase [Parabacteroides merdae]RHH73991.1 LexA family transcriptional regulator [Parabacteroides merdae]
MDIRDRIIQFVDYKGLSFNFFEKNIGASKSYISNTKNISAKVVSNILRIYPELSPEWVLTGEGSMFKKENAVKSNFPVKSEDKGVPYYNVDFVGGFDLVINDQTTIPEYLIDFPKYNEATCWCNVTGHSMEPEITHGDIIALKKIEDISFLPYGEIYAIVTKNEMRTIKRIGPSQNKDCYSLIPTNKSPEYGVQELPKEMVRIVFKVLGCMKRL